MSQLDASQPLSLSSHLSIPHPFDPASVAHALTSNSCLTSLDICNLQKEALHVLTSYLRSARDLVTLSVHQVQDVATAEQFAACLAHNTSLKNLHLENLGTTATTTFATALLQRPAKQLHRLALRKCSLSPRAVAAVSQAVAAEGHSVCLKLQHDTLQDDHVAQLISGAGHLSELDLSSNMISPIGARALSSIMASSSSLTSLLISHNALGDPGAIALAAALPHTRSLTHLDLSSNNITSTGASALAHAFPSTPTLKTLNLNSNQITTQGFIDLLTRQHTACTLHTLLLDSNSIAKPSLPSPCPPITPPTHLQHLLLSHNALCDIGMHTLMQLLGSFAPALTTLELRCCNISDASICDLDTLMQSVAPALTSLNLASNHLSASGIDRLQAVAMSPHLATANHVDLQCAENRPVSAHAHPAATSAPLLQVPTSSRCPSSKSTPAIRIDIPVTSVMHAGHNVAITTINAVSSTHLPACSPIQCGPSCSTMECGLLSTVSSPLPATSPTHVLATQSMRSTSSVSASSMNTGSPPGSGSGAANSPSCVAKPKRFGHRPLTSQEQLMFDNF